MKVFRFTTEVPSVKTIQYIVEAETEEEATEKLKSGSVMERDEGEEVDEVIDWGEETIVDVLFIEELETTVMKTENELWEIIEKANWKSDHHYKRIVKEWSNLDEDTFVQLARFINAKASILMNDYEEAWLDRDGNGGISVSDDGWMDLTADVVGRGEQFYNDVTADKLRKMADENDYEECFLYCLHKD
jgi:hypothetical protein